MRRTDEFVAESKRRAAVILEKRRKKRARVFTACVSLCGAALVIGISILFSQIELAPITNVGQSGLATVMVDDAVGGYVLLGVTCFTLGAGAALLCSRYAKKRSAASAPKKARGEKRPEVANDADLGQN